MKGKETLELIITLIIVVAILGAYFNVSDETINHIVDWLVSIFIGVLLSAVSGAIVEAFKGDFLKMIFIPIKIGDFKFSISVFVIATFMVRILLFGF